VAALVSMTAIFYFIKTFDCGFTHMIYILPNAKFKGESNGICCKIKCIVKIWSIL